MVAFGVLGWVLRKLEVPLVPVILGTLLGNAMEANLRRAVSISNGDWFALADSWLSIGIWTVAIVGFILPIFLGRVFRKRLHDKYEQDLSD